VKWYAIIDEYAVVEVRQLTDEQLESESRKHQLVIDVDSMEVRPVAGWTFDGLNFRDLTGNLQVQEMKRISKLAFRNRFTFAEKVIIESAMVSSPELKAWYQDFLVSHYIDLNRLDTQQGIMFLAAAGILTVARANEILTAPLQEHEIYRG
jgi:hypothetical protein